jgi:carbonic anhydrase/acetyltransferase-like protein (isoleucine patch superfamily)
MPAHHCPMPNIRPFRGQLPRIAEGVWVDDTALVIGDVTIGRDSSLWPYAVARGDINRITIGARTNVQDGSVLHVSHVGPFNPEGAALAIGDDVTVGHRVTLHGCTIGDRCLIGMGAIVLDRAVVEPRVMVGAGTLVPGGQVLASGFLYVGQPARRARPLSERELDYLDYVAAHYVELAGHYLGGGA